MDKKFVVILKSASDTVLSQDVFAEHCLTCAVLSAALAFKKTVSDWQRENPNMPDEVHGFEVQEL